MNGIAVIIPARMSAVRLPGKPLLRETGKFLIQHVYEAACAARRPSAVIIATDDERIADAAHRFGAQAVLTSPAHRSGTDRVAEAAATLDGSFGIIVNLQGDEPEIDPEAIDCAAAALEQTPAAQVATLACPLPAGDARVGDPACVKVVCAHEGRALYFSRHGIPFMRNPAVEKGDTPPFHGHLQHVGLYAYRRQALEDIGRLPASSLESLEGLEQLRWLQAGWHVQVALVAEAPKGIDTPDDYRRFVERCRVR